MVTFVVTFLNPTQKLPETGECSPISLPLIVPPPKKAAVYSVEFTDSLNSEGCILQVLVNQTFTNSQNIL